MIYRSHLYSDRTVGKVERYIELQNITVTDVVAVV